MNVLFIHGFGGGKHEYIPIQLYLKSKFPDVIFHNFLYEKRFGQVHIEDIAKELGEYIKSRSLKEKIFVVAISQGGIIFREMIRIFPELKNNIEKVVTLCTPHKGSLMAYLLNAKGSIDLRPNSRLLKLLDSHYDGLKYYSVYNPLDLMVFPGTNAIFNMAIINKKVWALSHPLTFYAPQTLKFIEAIFSKN